MAIFSLGIPLWFMIFSISSRSIFLLLYASDVDDLPLSAVSYKAYGAVHGVVVVGTCSCDAHMLYEVDVGADKIVSVSDDVAYAFFRERRIPDDCACAAGRGGA